MFYRVPGTEGEERIDWERRPLPPQGSGLALVGEVLWIAKARVSQSVSGAQTIQGCGVGGHGEAAQPAAGP